MPVWDVSRLPERDQFDYWREVICQAFVPLTPGRKEPGRGIRVDRWRRGRWPRSTAPGSHPGPRRRATARARSPPPTSAFYFVNLQLAGRCRTQVRHDGDRRPPGAVRPRRHDRAVLLRLRRRLADAVVPRPAPPAVDARPRVGVPVDGIGVGGVVTSLMRALWHVEATTGPAAMRELEQAFAVAVSAATSAESPCRPDAAGGPAGGRAAARAGPPLRQLPVRDQRLPPVRHVAAHPAQPVRRGRRDLRRHRARAAARALCRGAGGPGDHRHDRRGRFGTRLRRSDDVHPRLPAVFGNRPSDVRGAT